MINTIAGILLLLTFIGLIYYSVKGGNLLIGFLVISVIWSIIGRVPIQTVVSDIFEKSVENYGPTIAIIVFGAWFGRVLVNTGIADYIIKKTVELGGDRPLVVAILLNVVCALIFTSAFGVGSVMAIGMIVLPILFSLGISKNIAIGSYLLSVASGMYLNIAYVNQFHAVFKNIAYDNKYIRFAIIAMAIHVVVMIFFIISNYLFANRKGKVRAWSVSTANNASGASKPLSWYCVIVPFIPILMVAIFKWQPVPAFLLGIFLGLLLTHNLVSYKVAVEKVQKTLYDGVADTGLLIGLLYSVNIFEGAANQVAPLLKGILGGIIPTTPIVLVITFCILAPLALFRGPLMIWGSGIALAAILQSLGVFSNQFLFALFLIPPVAIVASSCPTQSWSMWALSYYKLEPKQYILNNI